MRLWIEVEDLFDHASHVRRPSGIQRLAFELQRALVEIAPASMAFIRHSKDEKNFIAVPFSAVEALFSHMAGTSFAEPDKAKEAFADRTAPGFVENGITASAWRPETSGPRLQSRIAETLHPQKTWIRSALRRVRVQSGRKLTVIPEPTGIIGNLSQTAAPVLDFDADAAPGDWLIIVGTHWRRPVYAAIAETQCRRHGLRIAVLLYDIISIRRPEWFDRDLHRAFSDWFHSIISRADAIFAISSFTAADVTNYARQTGLALRAPVQQIPLGTGFGTAPTPVRTSRLPAPRSYALIVSTIEARKNHALLFRVWRELLETMPAGQVPILVFAGRIGWLVQDLIQQLENTDWLNGKIMLIESPTDGELAAMYQDCLFTLFPSFYEGWGLPVTESLAQGAPCLAADRTSLPEAGGTLARYFDPDNLADAVRAIRDTIENPDDLQSWRDQIARDFRITPWSVSAHAVFEAIRAFDKNLKTSTNLPGILPVE